MLLIIAMASKETKKNAEPVPEGTEQDTAETKRTYASYAEASKARKRNEAEQKRLHAERKEIDKACDHYFTKTEKDSKKGRKKQKRPVNPDRKLSGIEKECLIPKKLLTFINKAIKEKKFTDEYTTVLKDLKLTDESKIPRAFITKTVYNYVQCNELYQDNGEEKINKKFMIADADLKKLFSMTDDEELTFTTMQTMVSRLVPKSTATKTTKTTSKTAPKKEEKEDEEEEEEEYEDEEEEKDEEDEEEEEEEDEYEDDEEEEEEEDEYEDEEEEVVPAPKKTKKTTKKVVAKK